MVHNFRRLVRRSVFVFWHKFDLSYIQNEHCLYGIINRILKSRKLFSSSMRNECQNCIVVFSLSAVSFAKLIKMFWFRVTNESKFQKNYIQFMKTTCHTHSQRGKNQSQELKFHILMKYMCRKSSYNHRMLYWQPGNILQMQIIYFNHKQFTKICSIYQMISHFQFCKPFSGADSQSHFNDSRFSFALSIHSKKLFLVFVSGAHVIILCT